MARPALTLPVAIGGVAHAPLTFTSFEPAAMHAVAERFRAERDRAANASQLVVRALEALRDGDEPIDTLAVGFADGVAAEKLDAFLSSFFAHAPPRSQLVLFAYERPPDVATYGGRVRVVRAARAEGLHLSNHRFALYRAYVESMARPPRLLLNSDVSDVVFQGDPFIGDEPGKVYTSLEGERKLGDGSLVAHFNNLWLGNLARCVAGGEQARGHVDCSLRPTRQYWR